MENLWVVPLVLLAFLNGYRVGFGRVRRRGEAACREAIAVMDDCLASSRRANIEQFRRSAASYAALAKSYKEARTNLSRAAESGSNAWRQFFEEKKRADLLDAALAKVMCPSCSPILRPENRKN